ncbi:MAG: ABC transporter permease [Acidobacteria bacterium]|jgi:ABC-type transport system involved in multi-copper enzyme maturation permease subunit|nr:ABC transporter permease [Acidobacteriota bacterium]
MPIREKGYYNWEGQLKTAPVKWLPIFVNGIKSVYKKKFSKILFATCAFTFLIFLIAVYVSTKPELKMLANLVKEIQSDALLFNTYYTNDFLIFMMVVLSLFAGSELISGDLKYKSFIFYLSRPLSRLDYVKGKYAIVLFYLLAFTLVPGLLLIIAKIIFSGELSISFPILLAAIIFPIVMSFFLGSFTIMLSALSANSRFVKVMIFVAYMTTNAIGKMFNEIFNNRSFMYLAFDNNIKSFGEFIFGVKEPFYTYGFISGCILVGLTILFFTIIMMRIKRVEV